MKLPFSTAAGIAVGTVLSILVIDLLKKGAGINIDPSDPENIVSEAVDDVVRAVTFEPEETLGGWLYEKVHGTYDPNDDRVTFESYAKTFPDNVINAQLGRPQFTMGPR